MPGSARGELAYPDRALPRSTHVSVRHSLASKAAPALELLGEYPDVFDLHVHQDVLLVNWYGLVTAQALPQFDALCAQWRERSMQPTSCVQLLTAPVSRLPDAEAREELTRINREYDSMIACCAVLIPVQGFIGSAVRGLVTAIALKTRRTQATLKIVGTNEAAVEWLVPAHRTATGRALDAAQLLAALNQVLAQH